MVIWVAVGGRGTLIGAVLGAVLINYAKSLVSEQLPETWLFIQGGLFLLQAAAGALLQGEGFGQFLRLLLLQAGGLQHLLPAAFSGLQLLLGSAMASPFLLLFGAELGLALLVLSQPLL